MTCECFSVVKGSELTTATQKCKNVSRAHMSADWLGTAALTSIFALSARSIKGLSLVKCILSKAGSTLAQVIRRTCTSHLHFWQPECSAKSLERLRCSGF